MPFDDEILYDEESNIEKISELFNELYEKEELLTLVENFEPTKVLRVDTSYKRSSKELENQMSENLSIYEDFNAEPLSKILELKKKDEYELSKFFARQIGPHFFYEVNGGTRDSKSSQNMRYELLTKLIERKKINMNSVKQIAYDTLTEKSYDAFCVAENPFSYICYKKMSNREHRFFSLILQDILPLEALDKPTINADKRPDVETITASRKIKPLHDYQLFAAKEIRKILESKLDHDRPTKRLLISIPTGAGKTRLVAESVIDWENAGRPSKKIPNQIPFSERKYVVWIAQNEELCEQAISQFEELYRHKGSGSMTVFRFFGANHKKSLESIMNTPCKFGLIVCTINKLFYVIPIDEQRKIDPREKSSGWDMDGENEISHSAKSNDKLANAFYENSSFKKLRKLTSCVIFDEAHHAVAPMYTRIQRAFGFNFNFQQKLDESQINEEGIVLVGLTATAFRGTIEEKHDLVRTNDGKKCVVCGKDIDKNKYPECNRSQKPIKRLVKGEAIESFQFWHTNCENIRSDTRTMYNRFSKPLIPRIDVHEENFNPVAVIQSPSIFYINDTGRFNAEKSFDNAGEIISYSWTIKKRKTLVETYTPDIEYEPVKHEGEFFDYHFKEVGTFEVSLEVTNYEGAKNISRINVIVEPIPEKGSDDMRDLIQNLIKKKIQSRVFHEHIKSRKLQAGEFKIESQNALRKQAQNIPERNLQLVKIINYLISMPEEPRKKVLVYACGLPHARYLANWLKMDFDIDVTFVDNKLSASRNSTRIRWFRENSDRPKVLINTDMLTTGFDVPAIDCVVVGRPVISTVEYTQMIGRGLRGPKMGGTPDVWIVDFDDQIQWADQKKHSMGWYTMAFDSDGNKIWNSLSEKLDKNGLALCLDFRQRNSVKNNPSLEETSFSDNFTHEMIIHECNSCKKKFSGAIEISENFAMNSVDKEVIRNFILNSMSSGASPSLSDNLKQLKSCNECTSKEIIQNFVDEKNSKDKTTDFFKILRSLIFEKLGFIPNTNEKFLELLNEDQKEQFSKRFPDWISFLKLSGIVERQITLNQRSEIIDNFLIELVRGRTLETVSKFDTSFSTKVNNAFGNWENFSKMVKPIEEEFQKKFHGKKFFDNNNGVGFKELITDYQYVQSKTEQSTPTTEIILKYSTLGLASYAQYCNCLSSFENILQLGESEREMYEKFNEDLNRLENFVGKNLSYKSVSRLPNFNDVIDAIGLDKKDNFLRYFDPSMTFSKDTIVTFTNNRSKLIAQLRKLSQHKSMDDFFSYQIHNWIVLHCFFESPEEIINICYESNRSIVTERWNQFKNENGIKEL